MNLILNFSKETLGTFRGWFWNRLEARGISQKKLLEYFILFPVLWFIYYRYFKLLARTDCPEIEMNLSFLAAMLKFILCAGWPFALIACIDPAWQSRDAARVALASYASYCIFVLQVSSCPMCIFGAAVMFFPLVFSASILHAIGSWRHSARFKK